MREQIVSGNPFENLGKVYITGAGPGDPELITVKGLRIIGQADVVVYDRLANPELLANSPEGSEHIYVGKKPGKPSVPQSQINRILISKAREGKQVVRLKGGDPFIFGRGGEECEALASEDIPFEVIPGISSAISAPAYAGIPLTHRDYARSFAAVTGHARSGADHLQDWQHLAHIDTLVILMGLKNLPNIINALISFGRSAETPVSIIEKATHTDQRHVTGTLATIQKKAEQLSSPATIVVGDLASMSNDLAWFKEEKLTRVEENYSEKIPKFAG
jgi:uroporphyrin-III C-methyltransferase